jgi:hypothetical protein
LYIDLSYYKNNGGKTVEDTAFPKLEFRARMMLDRLTQGRIQKMKAVPETVKRLMVELIGLEIGQGAELTERKSVTSFSNDGYSETYADPLTGEQVKEIQCNLVSEYLSEETDDEGTPLLYLGV